MSNVKDEFVVKQVSRLANLGAYRLILYTENIRQDENE